MAWAPTHNPKCDSITIRPPAYDKRSITTAGGDMIPIHVQCDNGGGTIEKINGLIGRDVWKFPKREGQPFVTYEKSDEAWAIPLGFGRFELEPLARGDLFNVSFYWPDFSGKAFVTESAMDRVCRTVRVHRVEFEFVRDVTDELK